MKKLLLISLVLLGFVSCNSTSNKDNVSQKEEELLKPLSSGLSKGCYVYNDNQSIINFEITNIENGVNGRLTYALYEKDKNVGTFNGKIQDHKLLGTYTFMSEGVESKREVAFLIKDNELIEGYGELNESGNAFLDKNEISYTSTMPLTKADCDR